ncbi:FadR/GntR family transcriptional regulator [Ilumatobacter nonamiensis]|uniref:FadR/GntR family transcriptional regulator n=1 Tax=Ilumatobacter nonamiensis TaxID=467093 RepID=UPI000590CF2B|nr:FadR/GntR family transcriptional regulator [Ilumatobacter nonamiensis]
MTNSAVATDEEEVGFAPVTRSTLSSQIRDQLLERITSGALEPGARVPSERSLSEQFGVARTSVREAMQGLLSLGVVVRRGNRSYVAEQLPDVSFDQVDDRKQFVEQLFETRRLLEIPMIELAAQRGTPEQRAEISEIAERFSDEMTLPAFRELDRQFHTALAAACGNPLLVELYGKVMARLFRSEGLDSLLSDDANRSEVGRIVSESAAQHARLASAVASGDVEQAAQEGVAHLRAVERSLIDRLV